MLTSVAVNRDLIGPLSMIVFEERINADSEVELDEEEEYAKLRYLKTEEHSNDAKNECQYEEENVENHVRDEEAFGALQNK